MTDTPEVAAARIEAERARAQLFDSVRALEKPLLDLKTQLTPRHIMGEVWEGAKDKGADLAEDAVDAIRARPLTVTGVVAAITLFLAREPLMDLASRLVGSRSGKPKNKKRRKTTAKATQSEEVE